MVHHTTDPEADWADAILGTDSYAYSGFSHSLQGEVDMYFNDSSTASYTSIMTFWQVSHAMLKFSLNNGCELDFTAAHR